MAIIYTLYNGNGVIDPDQNSNTVYVFKLDGTPYKKILLDEGVVNFDIYNEETIYGINRTKEGKFKILKFDIRNEH